MLPPNPVEDTRPFAEVLRDWLGRHNLTAYRAAKTFGIGQGVTVSRWLAGAPIKHEVAMRRAMRRRSIWTACAKTIRATDTVTLFQVNVFRTPGIFL